MLNRRDAMVQLGQVGLGVVTLPDQGFASRNGCRATLTRPAIGRKVKPSPASLFFSGVVRRTRT